METNRQRKVSAIVKEELATLFRKKTAANSNVLITVVEVKVTVDLSIAKVYISVFPSEHRAQIMKELEELKSAIRGEIGNNLSKNLRQIPELVFFLDDSLDTVDLIDKELKGKGNNPVL